MSIKIKSLIYRYTTLFLAHKEQFEYVSSEEFWKEFDRLNDGFNDLEMRSINNFDYLVGTWQAKNGFTRLMGLHLFVKKKKYPYLKHVFTLIEIVHGSYLQLKYDLGIK